jgi:SRSO17 transposase
MSLLTSPEAQALLAESHLGAADLAECRTRLAAFLRRFIPFFYRVELRKNLNVVVRGMLSDLERKTCEPMAYREGLERKPIQTFVGQGHWQDDAVTAEIRHHVVRVFGEASGALIFDGSAFPKKGTASCGVERQWCGRLGKVENCQVGVFLIYSVKDAWAPLDRQLYLPKGWARDAERRRKTHVPTKVRFRNKWEIALDLLDRSGREVPHSWILGDDDFGKVADFRSALRKRHERYMLDIPGGITIRDLEHSPPRGKRVSPFIQATEWAARYAAKRWQRFTVRPAAKGPLEIEACTVRVRAKHKHRIGPEERLLVMRTLDETPTLVFKLTDAGVEVPLAELVRVGCQRHDIEELFEAAKGETGMDQYEVRSWVGWHHHITLSLLALWFLILECHRLEKKLQP